MKSEAIHYKYTRRNLLATPEHYMFSQYEGKTFLLDYLRHRENNLNKFIEKYNREIQDLEQLDGKTSQESLFVCLIEKCFDSVIDEMGIKKINTGSRSESIDNYIVAIRRSLKPFENWKRVETKGTLLGILIRMILSGDFNRESYDWISWFVKRFEVTKKIFTEYEYPQRGVSGNFMKLINYSLLAIVALSYYEKSGNFKMLNCALKLNDLICSVGSDLSMPSEILCACAALRMEVASVTELLENKGIELC